jgi:Concanavalin A-like lectin/glucanases superfamily
MMSRRSVNLAIAALATFTVSTFGVAWAASYSGFGGNGRGGPVATQPTCQDQFRGRTWDLYGTPNNGTTTDVQQICTYQSNGTYAWVPFLGTGTAPQAQSVAPCTAAPNIALYEGFDETSGSLVTPLGCAAGGTAFAAAGSAGGITYGITSGVPLSLGAAIGFDGNSYFQSATDVTALDLTTQNAVWEVWAAPTGTGTNRAFASKFSSHGWLFDNTTGGFPRIFVGDGTTSCNLISPTAIPSGDWSYVRATWTFSTATCTIQVNGGPTYLETAAGITSISTTDLPTIGARSSGSSIFDGQMGLMRITIGNSFNDFGDRASGYEAVYGNLSVGTAGGANLATVQSGTLTIPDVTASKALVVGSSGANQSTVNTGIGTFPGSLSVAGRTRFATANAYISAGVSFPGGACTFYQNVTIAGATTGAPCFAVQTDSSLYSDMVWACNVISSGTVEVSGCNISTTATLNPHITAMVP